MTTGSNEGLVDVHVQPENANQINYCCKTELNPKLALWDHLTEECRSLCVFAYGKCSIEHLLFRTGGGCRGSRHSPAGGLRSRCCNWKLEATPRRQLPCPNQLAQPVCGGRSEGLRSKRSTRQGCFKLKRKEAEDWTASRATIWAKYGTQAWVGGDSGQTFMK